MSIISLVFLLFLCVTGTIYYITPARHRWCVLLLANIIFFINGCSLRLLLCVLIPVFLTYFTARLISSSDHTIKKKKIIVGMTILANIVILILFKELNFFINNYNYLIKLVGGKHYLEAINPVAPLGISYITLMLIGYLLDVLWEKYDAQKNFAKFLVFIFYFPAMTSGPIMRYDEMSQQLYEIRKFDYEKFCFGLWRILWGLFKKIVIADRLAVLVAAVYDTEQELMGFYILFAVVSYTLQVYMDFSGCIDIVSGISELFGIYLPTNFNTPFFSTSLTEIWRRWHMTLGFWVKDYVLYPVLKSELLQKIGIDMRKRFGKKWGKQLPTWIGMFLVWFLVGFWHGGSWKYIFGSGIFFFFMIVWGGVLSKSLFAKIIRTLRINTECASWKLFQRVRTFLLFSASISLGRAISLKMGMKMLARAFIQFNPWIFFDGSLLRLGLDGKEFSVILAGLLIVLIVSNLQQKGSVREQLAEQNLAFRWLILIGLFWIIIILGQYGPGYDSSTFIYGQF